MKLVDTPDGSYYVPDDVQENQLPVSNPFEAVAEKVRRRAPVREPDPITKAGTEMSVGQFLSGMLGKENEKRYQLWPERMVRSAATAPTDALSGKLPFSVGLRREDFTDIPGEVQPQKQMIERAQDMAGLATGGVLSVPKTVPVEMPMPKMDRMRMTNKQAMQGVLASDAEVGTAIAALKPAPAFYSTLANVVKSAKMEKGTAEQWQGYLKNNGVKTEELDYVLGELPKGQISKSDLEKHVSDNKVQLGEVEKGGKREYDPDKIDEKKYRVDLEQISQSYFQQPYDSLTSSVQNDVRMQALERQNIENTKYSQWQLPGGENYREKLLILPKREQPQGITARDLAEQSGDKWEELWPNGRQQYIDEAERQNKTVNFTSSHWSEPNVLAHVRMNDRFIPDESGKSVRLDKGERDLDNHFAGEDIEPIKERGLRSLHIEEIQSDWHQKGRKEGYKLSKEQKDKLEPEFNKIDDKIVNSGDEAVMGDPDIREAVKIAVEKKIITKAEGDIYLKYADSERVGAVPDAPFKSTWSDVAIKRMIREAAEKNYDSISWTPGEAQAARYDLSKQIEKIHFIKTDKGYLIAPEKKGGGEVPVNNGLPIPEDKIAEYIGKEAADKIIERGNNPIPRPKQLPEGYSVIRDRNNKEGEYGIIPENQNHARSLVGWHKTEEEAVRQAINHIHSEQVQKHTTLDNVDLKIGGEGMKAFYDKMLVDKFSNIAKKFGGKVETLDFPKTPVGGTKQTLDGVHVLKLTPELKQHAIEKGFPLFEGAIPVITPVSHDPFADKKKEGLTTAQGLNEMGKAGETIIKTVKGIAKLIPVSFNPWQK